MQKHECPRCGSTKATTIMLPPGKDSTEHRPHPAFRCMSCDTQWSDQDEWTRLHASAGEVAGDVGGTQADDVAEADRV